jgi:MerR family transcriptional regulator/heat shock protein HspR
MARRSVRNGRYTISAVAEMFGVHQQTLRMYEREGLIEPDRSEGRTRYYSEDDLERLEIIMALTRDMGVNLAGVQVIIELREKLMRALERLGEFEELLESRAFEDLRERMSNATPDMQAMIPAFSAKLVRVRRRRA